MRASRAARAGGAAGLPAALLLVGLCLAPAAPAQEPADAPAEEPEADANVCIGRARLRGSFARKTAEIEPGARAVLDLVARAIERDCGGKPILIEGHTDLAGDPGYNQQLSEERALAVKRYLVERGIPAEQLRTQGYGETRPLSTDPSPEAQALNRRVSFVVLEP